MPKCTVDLPDDIDIELDKLNIQVREESKPKMNKPELVLYALRKFFSKKER